MSQMLKIDLVSDIACPWSAVGLGGLEKALANLDGEIAAEVTCHPLELNPAIPAGGQNSLEHIADKYGIGAEQIQANRQAIQDRAAEVGYVMNTLDDSRIYNTFDAHRLLASAKEQGRQQVGVISAAEEDHSLPARWKTVVVNQEAVAARRRTKTVATAAPNSNNMGGDGTS